MEIAKKQNYNTIKYNYCQVNLFDKSFYFYIILSILVANDSICLTSRGSGVRIPHHPPLIRQTERLQCLIEVFFVFWN